VDAAQTNGVVSRDEAQAVLTAAGKASGEGFISISAENIIVMASPLLEEMWGYEPGELVGKPVQTLIPPRYREYHTAGVKNFVEEDKQATAFDWAAVEGFRKDGTEFPIHIRIVRVPHQGRFLLVAAVRNAEPYHQARSAVEEALKLAQQGADHAELVKCLRQALKEVELLNLAME
jgi:PAS domain S-box-containing protein